MIPTAFDGRRFATYGVAANFKGGGASGPSKRSSGLQRANAAPLPGTSIQDARQMTIEFTILPASDPNYLNLPIETIRRKLLGAIQPDNGDERVLVAQISATDTTEVEMLASTGQYRFSDSLNTIQVDFYAAEGTWHERLDTTVLKQSFAVATVIPLYNTGGATVSPVLKLGYDTQRVTEAPTVGEKWRRTVTVSNAGERNWNRVRLTFDLGDTSAWVSGGKAQADGDDVRVWVEGNELPCTKTNFGAERSWVHVFATIPAGGSQTFEIVYGNPDATALSDLDLSTRTDTGDTYAADDLQGDSGALTAGSTTTATDSGATWETDEWANGFIGFTSGTGSVRYRRIASNTATAITYNRVLGTAPASGTKYVLWKSGIFMDGGRVTGGITSSAIQDTAHTNKWGINSLIGATVTFNTGSASPSTMTVASNTADTLTFTTTFSVNPAVNDTYTIQRYGIFNWNVDRGVFERDHRGLWRINRYHSKGVRVSFGDQTPGGWVPWLMLDNQDDFAQGRYVDEGAGGGHTINNWPYAYARRSVRSDNTWPEKGIADGVCFFDPRGLIGFDWDYQMKNENGLGQVVVLSQQPGGEDWQTEASDATTRAALVGVVSSGASGHTDLTGDGNPLRIYTGVLPADGVEIPSTEKKSRSIELRNRAKILVYLAQDDLGGLASSIWSVSAEAAMYDLQATVRLGGGTSGTPPYDLVQCGPRFGLASGQRLWINGAPSPGAPLLGLYSSSDVLVSRVPWAATVDRYRSNVDGIATPLQADQLVPIPAAGNLIANEDNVTNWTIATTGGVTASFANDASTVYDGGATAIKVTVTTTPAGAWVITLNYPRFTVVPGQPYETGFAFRRSGLTSAITGRMHVTWSYGGGTVSAVDGIDLIGGAMAANTTWYTAGGGRKTHPGSVATPATTEATVAIVLAGSGSTSGSFWVDQIALMPGSLNAYLSESEIGTISLEAAFRRAYHG